MRKLLVIAATLGLLGAAGCSDDSTPKADALVLPVDGGADAAHIDAHITYDAAPTADASSDYGSLTTVGFSSTYIYDEAQIQSSGATYVTAHMGGLITTAVFTGTYGAALPIPPTGSNQAYAAHIAGTTPYIMVSQATFNSAGTTLLAPLVDLVFVSDTIATGPMTVGVTTSDGAQLVVLTQTGTGSTATLCANAIGFGTINVTTATSTSATEGGSLAFTNTGNIALYYPNDTPQGDLTSWVTGSGLTLCAK